LNRQDSTNDAESLRQQGVEHFSEHRLSEALACFEAASRLDVTCFDTHRMRGQALLALGRPREALVALNETLRLSPDHWRALLARAKARQAIGDFDAATRDIDSALGLLRPDDPSDQCEWGMALYELERYPLLIRELSRLIEGGVGDQWSRTMRGLAHAKSGNHGTALADYDEVLRADPDCAWTHYCRGVVHLDMGQPEQAIADFDNSIRLDALDPKALGKRALARSRTGNHRAALEDINAAIRLDPDSATLFKQRADFLLELEEHLDAIDDYSVWLSTHPHDTSAFTSRGICHSHLNDNWCAIDDFDAALEIRPGEPRGLHWRAHCYWLAGELESALADLDVAISVQPDSARLHLLRGRVLSGLENRGEALRAWTRALEIDPKNTEARLLRARRFRASDDNTAALAELSTALELEPDNIDCLSLRASLWDDLDESDKAVSDLDRISQLRDASEASGENHMTPRKQRAYDLIKQHFAPTSLDDLAISERRFPHRVRADLQVAIDRLVANKYAVLHFSGIRKERMYSDGIDLSALLSPEARNEVSTIPPSFEEVRIGADESVHCLKAGLWLLEADGLRFVLLLEPSDRCGGTRFQLAAVQDERGIALARSFFKELQEAVAESRCYRGKILSLEEHSMYSGQSTGICVHSLKRVKREDVILPAPTLELLERNVIQFVRQRDRMRELGISTRKGLLFFGPPGTGKTHTIHFLAGALEGHTTLLVTAEQIACLDEYMTLARLLQPSIVVIEDVDLIARDRSELHTPGQESLLNKLLNEMDGLREDADILFLLTTNRPEALEAALASRPGRVDQAIEFPLPDDEGRRKLVRLYCPKPGLSEEVVAEATRRTAGVSASFIKELMRRAVQFSLEDNANGAITNAYLDCALGDMLFKGSALNRKLLGASAAHGDDE
jgi:cell division protease FtsH